MAGTPFAPQFLPPGFSDAVSTLERKSADAPLQAVRIRMRHESDLIYTLLAVPAATDLLMPGGVPMLGDPPYMTGESQDVEIQGAGRNHRYTVHCWSGRDPSGGQPPREACALVLAPGVLLTARAKGTGNAAAGQIHLMAVSLVPEGIGYWIVIDDQIGDEFLKGFAR
jgi:hypothetical protein